MEISELVKNEPPKIAHAFALYCAMGFDRSLPVLAERLGKKPGYARVLQRWAKEYNWNERVKLYDLEQIEKAASELRRRQQEERERMNERHAAIGTTQQARALELLSKLSKTEDIDARTAVALLKLAIEVERNARGESVLQRLELAGRDGGPIQTSGTIAVYLPQKQEIT